MHVYVEPIQRYLACQVCGGATFARREIKMTTTGMTFFDLDWLNRSADGAICMRCGFVHTFLGDAHRWVDPADANAADLPPDPTWAGPATDGPRG